MYQAPDCLANDSNEYGVDIFRYFLGRLVPGLKKIVALFNCVAIFVIFVVKRNDCVLLYSRLSGPA